MSEPHAETRLARDTVATMMTAAGLPVEEDRLDDLAGLLETAASAARHLDDAAARIPLSEALAVFDPAWREVER